MKQQIKKLRGRMWLGIPLLLFLWLARAEVACMPSVVHPAQNNEQPPLCDYVVWLSYIRDDVGGSGSAGATPSVTATFVARTELELTEWQDKTTATVTATLLRWRTRLFHRPRRPLQCGGQTVEVAIPAWDAIASSRTSVATVGTWNVVVSKLGLCVFVTNPIGSSLAVGANDIDTAAAVMLSSVHMHAVCNTGTSMALRNAGTFMQTGLLRPVSGEGVQCVPLSALDINGNIESDGTMLLVVEDLQPRFYVDVFVAAPASSMAQHGRFASSVQIMHNPWGCITSHTMRHHHHEHQTGEGENEAWNAERSGLRNPFNEEDSPSDMHLEAGWLLQCSASAYAVGGIGPCVATRIVSTLFVLVIVYQSIHCNMPWTSMLAIPIGLLHGPWWITLRVLLAVAVRLCARCCMSACVRGPPMHYARGKQTSNAPANSITPFLQTASAQRLQYEDCITVLLVAFTTLHTCANKVGDIGVLVCAWYLAVQCAQFRISRVRYLHECRTTAASTVCCLVRVLEIVETVLLCAVLVAWNITPAIHALLAGVPFANELAALLVFVIVPFVVSV